MNKNTKEEIAEAFRKAEASLYLSGKNPCGSQYYELIKNKIINGEITYEEARESLLNYHIEKSKNMTKANN